tara:strand:- start:440 stop:730 length:291 start_codon:yes stop_codon:yes gene_type:complete
MRKLIPMVGQTALTAGINSLDFSDQGDILEKVRDFSDFSEENNPWGERDFGSFDHKGNKIFWKIDYYGLDMQTGSENPADPSKTKRVLTIMLAKEY